MAKIKRVGQFTADHEARTASDVMRPLDF